MPRFAYPIPGGGEVVVTAANADDAAQKVQGELARLAKQTTGETVGTGVNKFLQGATLGWLDEASGAVDAALGRDPNRGLTGRMFDYEKPFGERYSTSRDFYRNNERKLEADHPVAATGLEVAGAIAPALMSSGATATPSLTRLAARGAVEGGLYGAGASEGDAMDTAIDTTVGAMTGGVAAPVIGRMMGAGRRPIDAPAEAAMLRDVADRGYDTLRAVNPPLPDTYRNTLNAIVASAGRRGIGQYGDETITGALDYLNTVANQTGPITYQQADDLIEAFKNASKSSNQTQATLAGQISRELKSGLPPSIQQAVRGADDAWRRSSRSEALTNALTVAQDRASQQGIGGNVINTMRQEVGKLITQNNKTQYFSPDEVAAMRAFVRGGPLDNLLRIMAVASPRRSALGGSVGGTMLGSGVMTGSPGLAATGALAMGAGEAARMAGVRMGEDSYDALQRQVLGLPRPTMPGPAARIPSRAGAIAGRGAASISPDQVQSLLDMLGNQ